MLPNYQGLKTQNLKKARIIKKHISLFHIMKKQFIHILIAVVAAFVVTRKEGMT